MAGGRRGSGDGGRPCEARGAEVVRGGEGDVADEFEGGEAADLEACAGEAGDVRGRGRGDAGRGCYVLAVSLCAWERALAKGLYL